MRDRRGYRRGLIPILLGLSVLINLLVVIAIAAGIDLRAQLVHIRAAIFPRAESAAARLGPRWNQVRGDVPSAASLDSLKEAMRALESLAYLSGTRSSPEEQSVILFDPEQAHLGLNLYCSAHAPEAILMDMLGNEVHRWDLTAEEVWSDFEPEDKAWGHTCWRRVHLLDSGDLLAIYTGVGLIKLDRHSHLQWAYRGRVHHDLHVVPDGTIYVLTRKAKVDPRYNASKPILEDFVTVLDPEGNLLQNTSVLRALEESHHAPVTLQIKKKSSRMGGYGDILHTNTIVVLDDRLSDRIPAFRQGNVLLSPLYPEMICVLDLVAERVIWSLAGLWRRQHEPSVLDNGNILLFDNNGHHGESRIIEFDPVTQEVAWVYAGNEERPFFSNTCGTCQRLPNGNTLVTESNAGRAFEVTQDNTIVWDFVSPHRAGARDEFIATLFDVYRIEPDFVNDWLEQSPVH